MTDSSNTAVVTAAS